MYIYRHFIEFNNREVNALLRKETDSFKPEDRDKVFLILKDSANSLLDTPTLTRQVRTMSRVTGLSKEKVLADAAVGHAQSLKYIA